MIVIKYGGSILNPDGQYSEEAINKLKSILTCNPEEEFCLIIGGGKICRYLQEASQPYLEQAKLPSEQLGLARDELGIATTKINARYLQSRLQESFAEQVCPDLLIDPSQAPPPGFRIYLATGHKPGNSTDYITLLLSKQFKAQTAIKISDFPVVLDVEALEFDKTRMSEYQPLPQMTWQKMLSLVGTTWVAGGNYPLDPKAALLGEQLGRERGFQLLIGQYSQLEHMISKQPFTGTLVKG
jgi:uridylate kinase